MTANTTGGTPVVIHGVQGLLDRAGETLGVSDWVDVTQANVDAFAALSGDEQWIHVDPQRAAAGPFGATVQHGFLTLGLATGLSLAIGLELLIYLALAAAATVLMWIDERGEKRRLAAYAATLAGTTALAFVLFASNANRAAVCAYMKMITLPKVRDALRDGGPRYEVRVPPAVAERARVPIERMVAIGA